MFTRLQTNHAIHIPHGFNRGCINTIAMHDFNRGIQTINPQMNLRAVINLPLYPRLKSWAGLKSWAKLKSLS